MSYKIWTSENNPREFSIRLRETVSCCIKVNDGFNLYKALINLQTLLSFLINKCGYFTQIMSFKKFYKKE